MKKCFICVMCAILAAVGLSACTSPKTNNVEISQVSIEAIGEATAKAALKAIEVAEEEAKQQKLEEIKNSPEFEELKAKLKKAQEEVKANEQTEEKTEVEEKEEAVSENTTETTIEDAKEVIKQCEKLLNDFKKMDSTQSNIMKSAIETLIKQIEILNKQLEQQILMNQATSV